MHRVLFVLLIALLPFRAWLGDAMATTMATDVLGQATSLQAEHHHAGSGASAHGPHDQHHEATGADEAASSHVQHAAHDEAPCDSGHTCQTCQTCHSAALSPNAALPYRSEMRQLIAAAQPVSYASAPAELSQKPPIF